MDDTVVVTIRFAKRDFELLSGEAAERRTSLSSHVRQLVFEGRRRGRVVQELVDALEHDLHLRLRLRALINNPGEG